MNKILLALTILGAGAGGFLTARRSTTQLQHQANGTREAWLAQTQLVAVTRNERAGLTERIGELKQALAQAPAVAESTLWSALQTNRADHLTPELRERLFQELGLNWTSSEDFIVVSKQTVRDIKMQAIREDKLTDMAAAVLALTPEERAQVEAAMQRVRTDFKDWALAHVERAEPKDDVVAQYTLPGDPAMSESISNNFAIGLLGALGRERTELILPAARNWMVSDVGMRGGPWTMLVKRYSEGNKQTLTAQFILGFGTPRPLGDAAPWELSKQGRFLDTFRPIFPNGWADVAEREGFELPKEPQKEQRAEQVGDRTVTTRVK